MSPQHSQKESVKRIAVAIDGPAAAGKSSTANQVARRVGFRHIDSGALYRAVTAAHLRQHPDVSLWREPEVVRSAALVTLGAGEGPTMFIPLIGGVDATDEIRGSLVTKNVSRVAQMPAVRDWVNDRVRALAEAHDVVVDGRDIGTVVLPGAALKVFLVADPWERARRRLVERQGGAGRAGPKDAEIAEETGKLVKRDAEDATQTVQARDAILIDTTSLTQEEQVERIVALLRAASGWSGK
jgi:cytidylate kinase